MEDLGYKGVHADCSRAEAKVMRKRIWKGFSQEQAGEIKEALR